MQLSITLHQDQEKSFKASDLGFLLHKNPFNTHNKELKFGTAHVLYPSTSDEECTACLYVEIDPIDLVRNYQAPNSRRELKQYVNDRPYVANSFLTVALSRVFGTALGGTCNKKPELVAKTLPLSVEVPVLPSRGGVGLINELFEPLGYEVHAERHAFDAEMSQWGDSPYYKINLKKQIKLSELLQHLYVLIPVLDDEKHYWVSEDEIEKLLRHGSDWIPDHPQKYLIVSRYLKKQGSLRRKALEQLEVEESMVEAVQSEDVSKIDDEEGHSQRGEASLEKPMKLNDIRIEKVVNIVRSSEVKSVIDFGCGEGKFLKEYLKIPSLKRIVGIDVSPGELLKAEQRLRLDRLPERSREKLELIQGSLTYFDRRTQGFDLATCIEVIEHIDEERLSAFEESLFGYASPKHVVITTPNLEYNALFENLAKGSFRHPDHRFEWDRATFKRWSKEVAKKYNYKVEIDSIGIVNESYGAPTQMAFFVKVSSRKDGSEMVGV